MADADAFIRTFLNDPIETITRLAFSDWLEETGTLSNLAWSCYLRRWAEALQYPEGSRERKHLEVKASTNAPQIAARLTISTELAIRNYRVLHSLIPTAYITVNLAEHTIPIAVIEVVPESVARENLMLPLALQGDSLLVVTTEPDSKDSLQKLEFILNKEIVAVRGEADDILNAINLHYGQTETESVDCISYESPMIGLDGDAESRVIFGIFHTAFSRGATGFDAKLTRGSARIRYQFRDGTNLEEESNASVYCRLCDHLLALEPEAKRTNADSVFRDVLIPLLSNRPFPATVERPRGRGRPQWFRLVFRW